MNHVWYERRVHLAGIAGFTLFALWLVLGQPATRPVVSGWSGDGVANTVPQGATASDQLAANTAAVAAAARNGQSPDVPWGNPLGTMGTVMTQGYGVGTHAPAATWGGIDLAADPDGNGRSNPEASMGAPLYATMRGVVTLHPNSQPAGNHLWIKNARYKVGYAHLSGYAVKDGQTVEVGDLIGFMGATGQATGPHLHYHIWEDGVNVNPLKFGALPE
jgi:murein DD-endopeptidase MepM/ murein hydrolase activator NlpD